MPNSNSYSTLTEQKLFEMLMGVISGASKNQEAGRIAGLEELEKRILSNTLQNKEKAIKLLLDYAKVHGNNRPASSLITRCFVLCAQESEESFQIILDGVKGQEGQLFLCFSKAVLALDYKKKKNSIPVLIDFLMSGDSLNGVDISEVYECLVSLGDERLSKEIVKAASPYLNSSPVKMCKIIYSVRLCSKFAGKELLPNMIDVVKRSKDGYYKDHSQEIEKDVCQFFERVKNQNSLPILLDLLKVRTDYRYEYIVKAVAKVLDTHSNSVEHLIEVIYDNRRNIRMIYALLECFIEMQVPKIPVRKLLDSIRLNWWTERQGLGYQLKLLFVKMGKVSKPILFEIIKDDEKYDFALDCLKEIGVSNEELTKIFPDSPMLQVYNFLYSEQKKKNPETLDLLWREKTKLGKKMPGVYDRFEHLLLHIFSCFNFATLNVAPLSIPSIDIICFHPETVDLFIIGCTTGTLQDDLAKMDSQVKNMQLRVPEIFRKCSVTPIVASSELGDIHPFNEQYAAQNSIVIMQREDIDKLLEMLITNRTSRKVIKYIKSLKQEPSSDPLVY